tara:strand:- start:566 stop:1156 length:591 start_codon:yes stop_codon:yes gene_type:complete
MKIAAIAQVLALTTLMICGAASSIGQEASVHPLVGNWRINEELSEDTDEAVEAAIIKAGGKVAKSWFKKKEKGRYRGGPEEQELYDRISYDDILRIDYTEPEFWFGYADGYQRVFHTDGRTRSVGASDHYANGGKDFSIGQWEGQVLYVEGRPRDGGFTLESYTVEADGKRLRAQLELKPANFGAAVKVVRIYDRQ